MLPIIKNCNLYIGNDTGFMHISSALNLKTVALFMDSPVQAYGKYSKNIECNYYQKVKLKKQQLMIL